MADPLTTIPLQVPTSTVKNAGALQVTLSGNPHVVEWVLAGHPLPLQGGWMLTTAQTDLILIPAPGAGARTTLTMLSVTMGADVTSALVGFRIGFVSGSVPILSSTLTPQMFVTNLTPGGGIIFGNGSGPIAQGAANQPLKITCNAPTGGALHIMATYFQPQLA